MDGNDPTLALTNENQRLVNLNLLDRIRAYQPGGMKGLFGKLDASLKGEDLLKYEGMKKAVNRNLKELSNLAENPDELARWLGSRKKSKNLQLTITPNHFLLNNILVLLGIRFEDLFDKDALPGTAEKNTADIGICDDDTDSRDTNLLLMEINNKLDEIKDKYIGKRIRNTYKNRYSHLHQYFLHVKDEILPSYITPELSGFSKMLDLLGNEMSQKSLYDCNFYYVTNFIMNMTHRECSIRKSFLKFQVAKFTSPKTRRLFIPFFLLGILEQLLVDIINSGISNNKPIFFITGEKFSCLDDYKIYDNGKLLKLARKTGRKTIGFIKFILTHEVIPSDSFCEKCEKFFVKQFKGIYTLFQSPLPQLFARQIMNSKPLAIDKVQYMFKNPLEPDILFIFGIKEEQLGCFEQSIKTIEDLQIELEEYHA